jgi:hypothetical protein
MKAALAVLVAGLVSLAASASDVRQFEPGSYQRIVQEHAGKPFVLALWSLECAPCHEDLALFGRLLEQNAAFNLVLVSTDASAEPQALRDTLARHDLTRAESWVFAGGSDERLRYEIDRKWYGELPRTYLFAADGTAQAVSGKLDEKVLDAWSARNVSGSTERP